MVVTSPQKLIDLIPIERWENVKGKGSLPTGSLTEPRWVEPPGKDSAVPAQEELEDAAYTTTRSAATDGQSDEGGLISGTIKSKVHRLGDFVDTDAVRISPFSCILPARMVPTPNAELTRPPPKLIA